VTAKVPGQIKKARTQRALLHAAACGMRAAVRSRAPAAPARCSPPPEAGLRLAGAAPPVCCAAACKRAPRCKRALRRRNRLRVSGLPRERTLTAPLRARRAAGGAGLLGRPGHVHHPEVAQGHLRLRGAQHSVTHAVAGGGGLRARTCVLRAC
jgi:hypothetical protein